MADSIARLVDLSPEVDPLARSFAGAGHRLYLVGGIVRDLVLDRLEAGYDLDFTTDAQPDTIKALVAPLAEAVWDQGARFGTIACLIGGRSVEITTFRQEVYDPGSRKPSVAFADAVETDLSRRDFTVNAMAIALPAGTLVDPFGGREDLARRRLRTPLTPEVSFRDDPLRMLRAARFHAGYDLVPDQDVETAMVALADRMSIVSVERQRAELDKLLALADPVAGFALLDRTKLLQALLPETAPVRWQAVGRVAPSVRQRLAVLLFDVAPAQVQRRLVALRYPRATVAAVRTLVEGAQALLGGAAADDPGLRRWAATVADLGDDALAVAVAVTQPLIDAPVDSLAAARVAAVEARRQALAEDLADLDPPLDGRAVMELLGLRPGPDVGVALHALRELRFARGPLDQAEAARWLRQWWAGRAR